MLSARDGGAASANSSGYRASPNSSMRRSAAALLSRALPDCK
jgi:hypothetical protein